MSADPTLLRPNETLLFLWSQRTPLPVSPFTVLKLFGRPRTGPAFSSNLTQHSCCPSVDSNPLRTGFTVKMSWGDRQLSLPLPSPPPHLHPSKQSSDVSVGPLSSTAAICSHHCHFLSLGLTVLRLTVTFDLYMSARGTRSRDRLLGVRSSVSESGPRMR